MNWNNYQIGFTRDECKSCGKHLKTIEQTFDEDGNMYCDPCYEKKRADEDELERDDDGHHDFDDHDIDEELFF